MPSRELSLRAAPTARLAFWLGVLCLFLVPAPAPAQTLAEVEDQFRHGDYQEVIRTAQKRVNDGDSSDWRILLIKALLTVGRYAEANSNAVDELSGFSSSIELRLLAREAALFQNDPATANRRVEEVKLMIDRRYGAIQSPDNLVPLGKMLLLLGVEPRLVLDNCFRQAENLNPPPRDAFLATGQLALDKHDFALAADAFRAGLKQFPGDPDLEAGLAKSFETSDREEMGQHIQAALAGNPRNIPALLLLTDHLIDAEQYDDAARQIEAVLKVNPHQPDALAYRAVLAYLSGDSAKGDAARADALHFWKRNPGVDYLIGLKLAQHYRFEEAAAAQRRALAFEPAYLPAQRQLAEDLLRLGRTSEGWELAQTVHQDDPYDVSAYNLVTLHDQMEKYGTLTNANFTVRMSALEAQLYGDRVLDLLGRARETLCRKYGVELTQPTLVEIFPAQKDFAVATFGMPGNPGYLGVCFGSVITANSPASQAPNPANWEDVLWHEFCHVVTLTATKNRMPRWLSEGISVYEERQANPAWGEHMNLAYRDMVLQGALTPLGKLSSAFLTPSNSASLQFAYYESSLVVDFLVQKYGLDTLKQILGDLRDGKEINEAITARTAPLPAIEKEFGAFVRAKADALAPGVDLEKPEPGSSVDNAIWKTAHPKNYYVRMDQARDLMQAKRWSDAKPVLESLADSYHGESREENPLWLLSVTERNLHEDDAELATLQKFATQETDFVDLYTRLIEIYRTRKDWPAVTTNAELLLQINPLLSLPYTALAEAGAATGRNDQAISAYRKLLVLDPPDPVEVHYQLARLLHERGGAEAEAKRHVLQALEDAPRYRDAQRLLLDIERAQDKAARTAPEGKS